jgi:hypothetical protein
MRRLMTYIFYSDLVGKLAESDSDAIDVQCLYIDRLRQWPGGRMVAA